MPMIRLWKRVKGKGQICGSKLTWWKETGKSPCKKSDAVVWERMMDMQEQGHSLEQ